MLHSRILPAATAAVFVLCTSSLAFADTHEHGLDRLNREITAVLDAKVSPVQAIAAAEKDTGGRAMKVDVERHDGKYLYQIRTDSNGKVAKVFIDPANGKVVRTDNRGMLDNLLNWDDDSDSAKLAKSPTTLPAAIATAEQAVGGTAIEARYWHDRHASRIDVRVAKNRIVYRVAIDPATGKVISGEAASRDEHDHEGEHND